MPFYDYRCATCGKTFEAMQSMSDDALTTCTVALCVADDESLRGTGQVSRVLFAPAIHFKGSGFHNTDYGSRRRGGDGDGGSANGGGESTGGGSGDGAKSGDGARSGDSAGASSGKTVGLDKV